MNKVCFNVKQCCLLMRYIALIKCNRYVLAVSNATNQPAMVLTYICNCLCLVIGQLVLFGLKIFHNNAFLSCSLTPLQDTFLPHVENGTITMIGATTENPSFHVNSALLSRCRVIVLEKLSTDDLITILENGVQALGGVVRKDQVSQSNNASDRCVTAVMISRIVIKLGISP